MTPQMIAMLVAQLGPAAIQMIQGFKQSQQAKELAPKSDPIYNIPESQKLSLANAQSNASSRNMAGYTNMQNMLGQNMANTTNNIFRASTSSQDALGALLAANNQGLQGQQEIGFRNATDYNQRQAIVRDELGTMAQYEDKKWTNDVLNKFLRDSAASSALANAGMVNQYQGAKGAFNTLGLAADLGAFKSADATGGGGGGTGDTNVLGTGSMFRTNSFGNLNSQSQNDFLDYLKSMFE